MNIEKKFRAWDETQKYMAYQGTPDLETIQSFMYHFGDKKLLQFTGITDDNLKEIYEGDIVKLYYPVEALNENLVEYKTKQEIIGTIWCKPLGLWIEAENDGGYILYIDGAYTLEKIGNIYENPELLKTNNYLKSWG